MRVPGSSTADLESQPGLRTPVSMNAPLEYAEYVAVPSHPPTSIKVFPVIQSDSYVRHTFGRLKSLEPDLLDTIFKLIEVLAPNEKFATVSQQGSTACVERRIQSKNAASWTNEQAGCFACRTCFNRRQPCMRPVGKHEWLLLPLPVELRHPSATWQQGAYYIYQGDGTNSRFPGVWRKSD